MSLSSDGPADHRVYCRICHICSAHNWHTLCSFCGHKFCERCPCEVSETIEAADTSFPDHSRKALKPRQANIKNLEPGQQFDVGHHSATTESKRPRRVQGDNKRKGSPTPHREDRPWKTTQQGSRMHELTEQKSTRSFQRHNLPSRQSIQSLNENPFLIADREAKRKASTFPATDNNVDTASRGAEKQSDTDHRNIQIYTDPLCTTGHDVTGHLTTTYPSQRIQDTKLLRYPQHDQAQTIKPADTFTQAKDRKSTNNADLEEDKYHLMLSRNSERVEPSQMPKDFIEQHVDGHDHARYGVKTADSSKTHNFRHISTQGSTTYSQKRSSSRRTTPVRQPTSDDSSRRESTASGRVFTPPFWLAHPSKQAGDAFSQ